MSAPRVTLAALWARRLPWLTRALAGLRSGGGHITRSILKPLPVNRCPKRGQHGHGGQGRDLR